MVGKVIGIFLQIVGGVTVFAVLAAISMIAYYRNSSRPQSLPPRPEFVLEWGGFDVGQNWSVVGQAQTQNVLPSDFVSFYCIQLSDSSTSILRRPGWTTGPEINPILVEGLRRAIDLGQRQGGSCLPKFEAANSAAMRVLFYETHLDVRRVENAHILVLHPATQRLYYVHFES